MRLQVFLSHNGVCSRRDALVLIQQGRVAVNGQIIREPAHSVTGEEEVKVDGRKIKGTRREYILLNKPAGYVTTKEDRFAEKTVMDLLPGELQGLHPVGRLDKDTEGLLLLTNDGDLTARLTHPSHEIEKTYFVRVGGRVARETKRQIESGILLEGRKTAPARMERLRIAGRDTEFLITIHEGRKRQIRLMLQQVGHRVIFLQRIQQGPIKLGGLKLGAWRRLTIEEIQALKMTKNPDSAAGPQPCLTGKPRKLGSSG